MAVAAPPLSEVVQRISESRADKFEQQALRAKFRGVRLSASAVLMATGVALLGLAFAMRISEPANPNNLWLIAGSIFGVLAGAWLFLGVCSSSAYARSSRAIRSMSNAFRVFCILGSSVLTIVGLATSTYSFYISLDREGSEVIVHGLFMSGLAAALTALAFSLIVAAMTPPLVASNPKNDAARVLSSSIRCWYLAVFAALVPLYGVVAFTVEDEVLPIAAVAGLTTFLLIQSQGRTRELNAALELISDHLAELHIQAKSFATTTIKNENDLVVSLLKLQRLWADDRSAGVFSVIPRVRAEYEYQVLLAFLLARISESDSPPVVTHRQDFFQTNLGLLGKRELAGLIAVFAWDLRMKLLMRSNYRGCLIAV